MLKNELDSFHNFVNHRDNFYICRNCEDIDVIHVSYGNAIIFDGPNKLVFEYTAKPFVESIFESDIATYIEKGLFFHIPQ